MRKPPQWNPRPLRSTTTWACKAGSRREAARGKLVVKSSERA
jgi:hypothetical protein